MLKTMQDTAYGTDHGLREINSREAFVAKHPLTTSTDIAPYVDRIAQGEANVMSSTPIVLLGLTSGTSGTSRFLPVTQEVCARPISPPQLGQGLCRRGGRPQPHCLS